MDLVTYLLGGRGVFLALDDFKGSKFFASCSDGGAWLKEVNSMSVSSPAVACVDAARRSSLLHVRHINWLLRSCDDRRTDIGAFMLVLGQTCGCG